MGIDPQRAVNRDLSELPKFVTNPDFCFEQKLDGVRAILNLKTHNLYNKKGKLFTNYREVRLFGDDIPIAKEVILLDGELVNNKFWAFDYINDSMPYKVRRNRLCYTCTVFHVQMVPYFSDLEEKARLAISALERGFEGLMVKNLNSLYQDKNAALKFKFKKTADCVVAGVREGKKSVDLALYDEEIDEWVPVGACSIYGKKVNLMTGDVVEVEYLYVTTGMRMYQPVLMRVRQDKDPSECHITQLTPGNSKAVMGTYEADLLNDRFKRFELLL